APRGAKHYVQSTVFVVFDVRQSLRRCSNTGRRRARCRRRPTRPQECPMNLRLRAACVAFLAATLAACAARPVPAAAPAAAPPPVAGGAVPAPEPESAAWWYRNGALHAHRLGAGAGTARNVIVFLGDGMGPTTVAAARILDGQRRGLKGEEHLLAWEDFPYTAFSKTYNTDHQTPDSAGTMTAIATGVKTHMGAIGVAAGRVDDCAGSQSRRLLSWLRLAASAGMATGIGTTSRTTQPTPPATSAPSPHPARRGHRTGGRLRRQPVAPAAVVAAAGGERRHGHRHRDHLPPEPRHARGHVRAFAQPRVGGRRRHAGRGDRGRLPRHRPAIARFR